MITDPFASHASDLTSPGRALVTITPSDAAELPTVVRAVWVGVGGDLVVVPIDGGGPFTIRNVPTGSLIDFVRIAAVRATGTTATSLIGVV